ncbi:MAG: aminotransferase class V-fold PLP-dependent enzyme [Acidobacteria bacterium]|nr:aminotransferase class V-fold PLP-dependent enzyme [Acidobacteriota bacterium]
MNNLFEIPSNVTYLNCANMAPQLRAVTEAGLAAVRGKASPWKLSAPEWFSGAEELRSLAAQLLGVETDGVALIPAVSYGIAVAAANIPVAKNQSIVLLDQEFPSNVYAWRELARRTGAQLITVKRAAAESWTDALEPAITGNTAVVAVGQCHWTDGAKIDLERVGNRARELGAALVVDSSQSLGACPLDIARVQPDFLVSVGYKWLLGPYGLGYLYVARKWRHAVPIEQSWLTRSGSEDFARLVEYRDDYRPGARRFDMGEFPQFVLAPMARTALQQILSWGIPQINGSLTAITEAIAQHASNEGFTVLPTGQRCGQMIGIRHRSNIPDELPKVLRESEIYVSIRGDSIRISPHLYNTQNDVTRLFAVLRRAYSRS